MFMILCARYGQTGSGKTYTMSGMEERILQGGFKNPDSDGIIPRALLHLFRLIDQNSHEASMMTYTTKASFLEIYNETVIDLLNPDRKNVSLSLRQYVKPPLKQPARNLCASDTAIPLHSAVICCECVDTRRPPRASTCRTCWS